MTAEESLKKLLIELYGDDDGHVVYDDIIKKISQRASRSKKKTRRSMSNQDLILITYPHQIQGSEKPLRILSNYYNEELSNYFSGVHILPFYPSTSDGGFAVKSYEDVDSDFGDWKDIRNFKGDLMFDAVFNHTSSEHHWFQEWLSGDCYYNNFYHMFDHQPLDGSLEYTYLKMVTRPRSSNLLTEFEKEGKSFFVWSTFGPDQLDVNFSNSRVLLEFVDLLLLYVEQGATLLRVDAVPFLWKELGTDCLHLPQTHAVVKVFRSILDLVKPEVQLVTESNVPHQENISYLGNSHDEAQMVYNFSLAPLILYSMVKQNTQALQTWVNDLDPLPAENCFFNFTATHDGIGVRPLEGILPDEEVFSLTQLLEKKGGMVSYREFEGENRPYEVNITWASAMFEDNVEHHIQKILTSYAMCYVFPGTPGVYFHNLIGTLNWQEGFRKTLHRRDINRRMFDQKEFQQLLNDSSYHGELYRRNLQLLEVRKNNVVFHPQASFVQHSSDSGLWVVEREYENQKGLFIFNVTDQPKDMHPWWEGEIPAFGYHWDIQTKS